MGTARVATRPGVGLALLTWVIAAPAAPCADPAGGPDRIAAPARAGGTVEALAELDKFINALPETERMICWRYQPPKELGFLRHAWLVGSRVVFTFRRGSPLLQLDAATGKALPTLCEPAGDTFQSRAGRVHSVAPCDGKLLLLTGEGVRLVDPRTGRTLKSLAGKFMPMVGPLGCADGFVAARGKRTNLVRLNWSGKRVWRCELAEAAERATACGRLLVIESRQNTTAIDVDTGRQLWSRGRGYCWGAAIGDDAVYVVAADLRLAPSRTSTEIVCVQADGREKWRCVQPGMTAHRPVAGGGHRVYVLSRSGGLACLDGLTGRQRWSRRMQAPPPFLGTVRRRRRIRLQGHTLLVVDGRYRAHLLDGATGRRLGSLQLTAPGVSEGKMHNGNEPVAAPWLLGDRVLVATEQWVAAYPAGNILAGRVPGELLARSRRADMLAGLGRGEEARAEWKKMQAARPGSVITLALQARLADPKGPFRDSETEVIARLELMRAAGLAEDSRLRELTGLVKRLDVGHHPTRPLVLGRTVYVGSRCGRISCIDRATLRPMKKIDLNVPIVSDLTFFDHHGGPIVFATDNRHTMAVSTDLKLLFDLPSRSDTAYHVLGGKLIRSWPAIPYTRLCVMDAKARSFGPQTEVKRYPRGGVIHRGRLYFTRPGGATVSYDGREACVHEALLKPADLGVARAAQGNFRVSVSGPRPIAFGCGGVYAVDEHLRPVRAILATKARVFAAAVNGAALAVLRESAGDGTSPWRLDAWSADGRKKMPLHYEMHRYACDFGCPPTLMALGDGFLLVGRELVFVRPGRPAPAWRFWPGRLRDSDRPAFSRPVVDAGRLIVTHRWGELLAFDVGKVLGR